MRIKVTGADRFKKVSDAIQKQLVQEVDKAVEKRALKMVNDTRRSAPVKTGKLRNSINIITQESKPMSRTYGTNVIYARKQEYEHATKKAFFRNNVSKHAKLLQKDVAKAVKNAFKE